VITVQFALLNCYRFTAADGSLFTNLTNNSSCDDARHDEPLNIDRTMSWHPIIDGVRSLLLLLHG